MTYLSVFASHVFFPYFGFYVENVVTDSILYAIHFRSYCRPHILKGAFFLTLIPPLFYSSLCVSCIWVTSVVFLIISGHNLSFLTLFPDHWSLGPGPGQSCKRSPGPGPTSALVTGSGPPPEWSRDRLHRPFGYRNLFPGASPSDRVWAECHIWIVAGDVLQLIRTIIKTHHHSKKWLRISMYGEKKSIRGEYIIETHKWRVFDTL